MRKRRRLDPVIQKAVYDVSKALKILSSVDAEIEPYEKTAREEELQEKINDTLANLKEKEFSDMIMVIRGRFLAKRMSLQELGLLNETLWIMAKEREDFNPAKAKLLRDVSFNLKGRVCSLFQGPLAGAEISFRRGEGGPRQHYSFAPIPERLQEDKEMTFSITRVVTQKILGAYDDLIQEAGQENVQKMVSMWKDQKEMWLELLKEWAPKLLEKPNPKQSTPEVE